eukprot:288211_1
MLLKILQFLAMLIAVVAVSFGFVVDRFAYSTNKFGKVSSYYGLEHWHVPQQGDINLSDMCLIPAQFNGFGDMLADVAGKFSGKDGFSPVNGLLDAFKAKGASTASLNDQKVNLDELMKQFGVENMEDFDLDKVMASAKKAVKEAGAEGGDAGNNPLSGILQGLQNSNGDSNPDGKNQIGDMIQGVQDVVGDLIKESKHIDQGSIMPANFIQKMTDKFAMDGQGQTFRNQLEDKHCKKFVTASEVLMFCLFGFVVCSFIWFVAACAASLNGCCKGWNIVKSLMSSGAAIAMGVGLFWYYQEGMSNFNKYAGGKLELDISIYACMLGFILASVASVMDFCLDAEKPKDEATKPGRVMQNGPSHEVV